MMQRKLPSATAPGLNHFKGFVRFDFVRFLYYLMYYFSCLFILLRDVLQIGDDIGANRTEAYRQLHSETGSRRLLTVPTDYCYTQYFVGGKPPTGFRPPQDANIKYICQQIEGFDGTFYVTMFDENIGIAVYAGYALGEGAAKYIGTFPRIQKWSMDKGCIQRLALDLTLFQDEHAKGCLLV